VLCSLKQADSKAHVPPSSTGAHEHEPKNTICLWFDKERGTRRRSSNSVTFPDSKVTAVHKAPVTIRAAKGRMCCGWNSPSWHFLFGLNGGPTFKHTEAFLSRLRTENQEERNRYWTGSSNGGTKPSVVGARTAGASAGRSPATLPMARIGGGEAKRAFDAKMPMKKIDRRRIEAARRADVNARSDNHFD